MKKSAFVGPAVERLLASEEMKGERLAADLNISQQLGSHIKNDKRKMQEDIARASINLYDNPEYANDILFEFSGGYTSPVFRGKSIEQHRLSIESYTLIELKEAIKKLEDVCLAKPPSTITSIERQEIKNLMEELLDGRAFIDNLLIQLQKDYRISVKECIRGLLPRWMAKGWLA
ncbi:XRE family transcriptional regulator [Psychrobacillus sp.]|uniref:XRE family transcriptional regulator n=1 Tax=Psychrobacillus sp. TaxID=1871623 RepID=UPI0028BD5407|nr:XRE family transcriptional regulator [Psychrobacillus sp.]